MIPGWTKFLKLKTIQGCSLAHIDGSPFDGVLAGWMFVRMNCFTDFGGLRPAVQTRTV